MNDHNQIFVDLNIPPEKDSQAIFAGDDEIFWGCNTLYWSDADVEALLAAMNGFCPTKKDA